MSLWIPITVAAAFLQNVRSAMQKHLKGVMGTTGATFVRFGYGLPFRCSSSSSSTASSMAAAGRRTGSSFSGR